MDELTASQEDFLLEEAREAQADLMKDYDYCDCGNPLSDGEEFCSECK